jgi:hypothetical protein
MLKYIVLLEWSLAVYTIAYSTQNDRSILCLELGILEAELFEVCHTAFEQSLRSFYRLGIELISRLLMN